MKIVFEANTKSGGEKSLDEYLYLRLSLTAELLCVLFRFRVFIAVVNDVEKAFLQIGLNSDNRNYVRFMCFPDVNKIDFLNFTSNRFVEYRF